MTRRPSRRAVPLCVLLTGLLAGMSMRATTAAHAHADPHHATHTGPTRTRLTTASVTLSPITPSPAAPTPAPATQGGASVGGTGDLGPLSTARLRADGSLSDIVALGAGNVWAVGQEGVWDDWQSRGVITHWDGTSWNPVGIRNDASGAGRLRSVAAASSGELWAVGEGHDSLPYVARGDGSVFDRVDIPALRGGDWLGGVAAVPGRVVAVGSRDGHPFVTTGTKSGWTVSDRKAKGTLYGVALLSAKEGWAVGDTDTQPMIMRLSGSVWKTAHPPRIKGGFLRDVYAESSKRAIAIGGVYEGTGKISPLVLAWNGKRWSRMRVPDRRADLYGVTGDGNGRFWISGFDPDRPGDPYMLRYEGGKWKIDRGEGQSQDQTIRLQAVAHVAGLTMAVGHVVDSSDRYTDVVETLDSTAAK